MNALLAIAEAENIPPAHVALAWVRASGVIPIIGPRTKQQLQDNLDATALKSTPAQLARLDAASAIPGDFPHDFLLDPRQRDPLAGGCPDRVDAPARPAG